MLRVDIVQACPLDTVTVTAEPAAEVVKVFDGEGRPYAEGAGPRFVFEVSGTLGYHVVAAYDQDGRERHRISFKVDCATEIDDLGGRFKKMLYMLRCTFEQMYAQKKNRICDGERVYHLHIITSRDTIFVHKGGKYFFRDLKDVIDLFAEHQRDDGMVFDFCIPVDPSTLYHFEWRWPQPFHKRLHDRRVLMARQPVMNDLDHMFIRGVYSVWQATGDDEWMAGKLDNALRAMRFTQTNEYIWSEKFKLLKRPYCLDLWDFQSEFDAALVGGDEMNAIPGVTKYGVFHGDNTGMAESCRFLAEMLRRVGRDEEAQEADRFADHIFERLEKVAWNGRFYQHHVSEDPSFERDFGVDDTTVVSLSNAYAINRGSGDDKAKAIIETYRRIREEMPDSTPAEFVQMYPPYPRGWHIPPGIYTNGAVTLLVGGELAHGCFERGYEEYGADIMHRIMDLFEPYGDSFIGGLSGVPRKEPRRTFTPVDMRSAMNADLVSTEDAPQRGWVGEAGNDMRELPTGPQVFERIPFELVDPAANDHKACLRLARGKEGFAGNATISVGAHAACVYFLHACAGGKVAGELVVRYADGSEHEQYVHVGRDVLTFWNPADTELRERHRQPSCVLAWRGANESIANVGLTGWGWNNPHPEKQLREIELRASRDSASWFVVALTLSDHESWFEPGPNGGGAPPNWSAGSLMYALAEGLGGVVDTDRNMNTIRFSPRWETAGVDGVTACFKYEEGGGYARYTYARSGTTYTLALAGNSSARRLELLLPRNAGAQRLTVNGAETPFQIKMVEESRYVCADLDGIGVHHIALEVEHKGN